VKYLVPWMCFDLWEFELCVIRVHAFNFFPCRGTKDLKCTILRMLRIYACAGR
jgi:hypothetical protein